MHKAQSLVEVLIGVALGALFIAGAAALIAPALRTNTTVNIVQTQTETGKELSDNVKAWAAGNWNGFLSLATTSSYRYYLATATSSFAVLGGTSSSAEQVKVGGLTYARYFYVNDVYRDGSGNITSTIAANFIDPSTKLVAVVVSASSSAAVTIAEYLTRNVNNVFNQTSWAGGAGQSNPITLVSSTFMASTDTVVTATGSIRLSVPPDGTCQL